MKCLQWNVNGLRSILKNKTNRDIFTSMISKYDLISLNEIKIESHLKKEQLLLVNENKIVWVIGHRIDDRFKLKKDTKKVLELCLNIKPKKK